MKARSVINELQTIKTHLDEGRPSHALIRLQDLLQLMREDYEARSEKMSAAVSKAIKEKQ